MRYCTSIENNEFNKKNYPFKDQLIECLDSRNENQFEYILDELNISPDRELNCMNGLSIFEKVLTTPNTQTFIELCVYHGSSFFKVSEER